MRNIHWNKLAKSDFIENIDYLILNWSEKEAQNFINKVFEIESVLEKGIIDFQETDLKDIRRCVINKHISLFYKIIDEKNIEFLRFWNNLQNPEKLYL